MNPHDQMQRARGEAIIEITSEMFTAAGTALLRHGDDPQARQVLLAATTMFVDEIEKSVIPGFRQGMIEMLRKRS